MAEMADEKISSAPAGRDPSIKAIAGANLLKCPTPLPHESKSSIDYTIGDLHGNALLGLWHAIKSGAVSLPEKEYQEFATLYQRVTKFEDYDHLSKDQIDNVKAIFQKITIANPYVALHFLGDVLCDRGADDTFTLLLFERFRELQKGEAKGDDPTSPQWRGANVVISNHDMYMLSAYARALAEKGDDKSPQRVFESTRDEFDLELLYDQDISKKRLYRNMRAGAPSAEEFCKLIEGYQQQLLAIDYTFVPEKDGKPPQLRINIHATAGFEAIELYAKYFGIPYEAKNPEELMHTIDLINGRFRQEFSNKPPDAKKNFFQRLWEKSPDNLLFYKNNPDNPLFYACESRGYKNDLNGKWFSRIQNVAKLPEIEYFVRPIKFKHNFSEPVDVFFSHGHDDTHGPTNFYSLDQDLGRPDGKKHYKSDKINISQVEGSIRCAAEKAATEEAVATAIIQYKEEAAIRQHKTRNAKNSSCSQFFPTPRQAAKVAGGLVVTSAVCNFIILTSFDEEFKRFSFDNNGAHAYLNASKDSYAQFGEWLIKDPLGIPNYAILLIIVLAAAAAAAVTYKITTNKPEQKHHTKSTQEAMKEPLLTEAPATSVI